MESKAITDITLQNKFESLSEKKGVAVRRRRRKTKTARSESESASTIHPLDSDGSYAPINGSFKTQSVPTSGSSDTAATATPTHWMREYFNPLRLLRWLFSPLRDIVPSSGLDDQNNDQLKDGEDKIFGEEYLRSISELKKSEDAEVRYGCTIARAMNDNYIRFLEFESSGCKDHVTYMKIEKRQNELYEKLSKWGASLLKRKFDEERVRLSARLKELEEEGVKLNARLKKLEGYQIRLSRLLD